MRLLEGKSVDKLKSIFILYIVMFIALGAKCNFKFGLVYGIQVVLLYIIFTFGFMNTYKMTIDNEYIKIYRCIGKNKCICIKDAYKIELQNHAWQLVGKNYILFVYTPNNIYDVSTELFKEKDLKIYLAKMCRQKGIEYRVIE